MKHWAQNGFKALTSACALSLLATAGWSQSLTWLGTLGGSESVAYGVSADGALVVGLVYNAAGQRRAFRWENGGRQDLGTLGGRESVAYDVSADGAVVVGVSGGRAFRWENGGRQDLGTLGGRYSEAYDVSADGAVVVGWSGHAFRWTP
jgi:probable HAF family extracellular repeat protein